MVSWKYKPIHAQFKLSIKTLKWLPKRAGTSSAEKKWSKIQKNNAINARNCRQWWNAIVILIAVKRLQPKVKRDSIGWCMLRDM